jgi:hypothetical protein
MRWGLIPSCAKDLSVVASIINARFETAATKPAFREGRLLRLKPISKDDFKERLSRYLQIRIRVIVRRFGRTISIPVWFFILGAENLHLQPVQDSDTQWYKNVLRRANVESVLQACNHSGQRV